MKKKTAASNRDPIIGNLYMSALDHHPSALVTGIVSNLVMYDLYERGGLKDLSFVTTIDHFKELYCTNEVVATAKDLERIKSRPWQSNPIPDSLYLNVLNPEVTAHVHTVIEGKLVIYDVWKTNQIETKNKLLNVIRFKEIYDTDNPLCESFKSVIEYEGLNIS